MYTCAVSFSYLQVLCFLGMIVKCESDLRLQRDI